MSEWCQNCHANIHLDGYTTGVAGLRHPAGSDAFLHAGQIQVYNTYVSSGVVDPAATSKYTSLVPFEQGNDIALATLRTNTASGGVLPAGAKSSVMCLSCHRAHASAFDSMVRWDQNATFLTDGAALHGGRDEPLGRADPGRLLRPYGRRGRHVDRHVPAFDVQQVPRQGLAPPSLRSS